MSKKINHPRKKNPNFIQYFLESTVVIVCFSLQRQKQKQKQKPLLQWIVKSINKTLSKEVLEQKFSSFHAREPALDVTQACRA